MVVTTGIAGSNFWRTALEALKLGLPLFVLPFTFLYNSEIVTGGFNLVTAGPRAIVLLGAIAVTHGLNCASEPFGVSSPLSYGVRAFYVALGVFAMVWSVLTPSWGGRRHAGAHRGTDTDAAVPKSVRSPTESSSSSGSNSAIVFQSSAARSRNIMNSSGVAVVNEQQGYS